MLHLDVEIITNLAQGCQIIIRELKDIFTMIWYTHIVVSLFFE